MGTLEPFLSVFGAEKIHDLIEPVSVHRDPPESRQNANRKPRRMGFRKQNLTNKLALLFIVVKFSGGPYLI